MKNWLKIEFTKFEKRQTNDKVLLISCGLIIFSFLIFVVSAIITRGSTLPSILVSDKQNTFMDFYNSVYDAANRVPYEHGVIYPPLCNLIYYIAARFLPKQTFAGIYHFPGGGDIRDLQGVQTAFIIYSVIAFVFLTYCVFKLFKNATNRRKYFVLISTLCTYPVIFTIERGNIVLYSFLFILFYVITYDTKNKFVKEVGLICLAIGGVLKIYPALYGILLIIDKRYKDAGRAILYGLLLFFVPFVFFGGMNACVLMLHNMFSWQNQVNGVNLYNYSVGVSGLFGYIAKITHVDFANYKFIGYFLGTLLVVVGCFEKCRWRKIAFITFAMIMFMPIAYDYYAIFILIPWFLMLTDSQYQWKKIDYYYSILYLLIYCTIPLGYITIKGADHIASIHTGLVALTIILFALTLLFEFILSKFKGKHRCFCCLLVVASLSCLIAFSAKSASGLMINDNVTLEFSDGYSKEAAKYIASGLSLDSTDNATWTNSAYMVFNYIDTTNIPDSLTIRFEIEDTYNGIQSMIAYDGNTQIFHDEFNGKKTVDVKIDTNGKKLKLLFMFPNAASPYELYHDQTYQPRALKITSISIIKQ